MCEGSSVESFIKGPQSLLGSVSCKCETLKPNLKPQREDLILVHKNLGFGVQVCKRRPHALEMVSGFGRCDPSYQDPTASKKRLPGPPKHPL